MKKPSEYVNVFQGSGEIDLPTPQGIAKTWLFPKAQCGNTTPAAAYPFGKTTVCAYTGAYPTGYSDRRPNSCGKPRKLDAKVRGFSHMHVSGTGAIRAYYNYAVASPIPDGRLRPIAEELVSEEGRPGYYSATLSSGVKFEGTVTKTIACHRYSFEKGGLLAVDFSNDGLLRELDDFGKRYSDLPASAEVTVASPTAVVAKATLHGIELYFAAECSAAEGISLWQSYEELEGERLVPKDLKERFGAVFKLRGDAELRLSISFTSCDAALEELKKEKRSFEEILACAEDEWERALSRIKIKSSDERFLEIFYSNLYHTLIKPCTGAGESFAYDPAETDGKFCFDLGTLWDMYKTAVPLIFTLYPEISEEITATLLKLIEKEGRSPINITAAKNNDTPEQARMLAEHIFADYYYRYGKGAEEMLKATERDLSTHTDFLESGFCERYTHILDICEGLSAMAGVARDAGKQDIAEKYEKLAKSWINAFDESTGLMSESSPYYEGDNYNYSFRLLHNMEERVALMGKEKYLAALDELFGYTREAVEMPKVPEEDPLLWKIHSFEGFNNESDMETPYAYIWGGRQDKTCEVVSAGHEYSFSDGRGGIPGNNDSGGLSSCYVWNSLGIFPVTGQNLMLLGSPKIDGASLALHNGKKFEIKVSGGKRGNIYPERILFNGREITDYRLSVREMMAGGVLEFYMSDKPNSI